MLFQKNASFFEKDLELILFFFFSSCFMRLNSFPVIHSISFPVMCNGPEPKKSQIMMLPPLYFTVGIMFFHNHEFAKNHEFVNTTLSAFPISVAQTSLSIYDTVYEQLVLADRFHLTQICDNLGMQFTQ